MIALLIAAKADVVLGALLVMRHRTPRLAALLTLASVAASLLASGNSQSLVHTYWVVLVIAGSLVSVAASRLLAPGAAMFAAYRVAASWWMVPAARLCGALLVTLPLVACAALVLLEPAGAASGVSKMIAPTGLYAAALAALVLAITPALGASAGATIGFTAAWFGTLPPSAISDSLEHWPVVQRVLVLAWNTLPLGWRASRWLESDSSGDGFLFVAWLLVGVATAAWAATRVLRSRNQMARTAA